MALQIGAWGTPEFGITEKLSSLFGQGRTAQGGSNLFGNQSQTTLVPASSGQFTQPGSAGAYGVQGAGYLKPAPAKNTGGGGGGQVLGISTMGSPTGTPTTDNPYSDLQNSTLSGYDANLASLNTQYDQSASQLRDQMGYLDSQRANTLSGLETQLQGVSDQVKTQKDRSQQATETAIGEAGNSAQNVQRANRNTLRALGILNSSAAGEMLSRPLQEFDKQRATFVKQNIDRVNELDNFYNQKYSEHQNAVNSVQNQFNELVGKIQSDLRFNDRQRGDAVQQAKSALDQRIGEIGSSLANYRMQVEQQRQNFALELAKLSAYNPSGFNTASMLMQQITPDQQKLSSNAQLLEEQRKKQTLSAY